MLAILLSVFVVIWFAYFGLLIFATFGWFKGINTVPYTQIGDPISTIGVTIVVPFRNEKDNLPHLVMQLLNQDYPHELLEIILVDDHSTDNWQLSTNTPDYSIVRVVNSDIEGKKGAIHKGVSEAKYNLILTTDADCSIPPQWVTSMVKERIWLDSDFLFGPVKIDGDNSFLSYFQTIDYLAMANLGAGASNMGQPFLCSGANLMFSKELYLLVFHELHHEFLSGDDVFLLHAFKENNFTIAFAQTSQALVVSDTQRTWSSLINQRVRWGSKATGYKDLFSLFVSAVVLLANGSLVCLLFWMNYWEIVSLLIVFKIFIDSLFVLISRDFFGFKYRFLLTLGSGLIYPIWILFIALKGFGTRGIWKGR